jgi:hypothetical protein
VALATLLACALFAPLGAQADAVELAGQLRTVWTQREAAHAGPLAQANALQPGIGEAEKSGATAQFDLRATTQAGPAQLNASATVLTQQTEGGSATHISRFNEAYAAGQALGWQWSAGKKVVSWDVGYAFRPNDLVQQEVRRTLAADTLEGRPLLMAEHFDGDTAWSVVWVNPTEERSGGSLDEAALAARLYQHHGSADWHVFARQGGQTGTSLGAAASWVATDALELHASVRAYRRVLGLESNVTGAGLAADNPWQTTLSGGGRQLLVGGTWTSESQVSVLVEAWHDDTALSDSQWNDWTARNHALPGWLSKGVPAGAVAGNLAWQGNAFGVSSSLRQDNLFVRLSWQQDRWQSALDVLYTPADQGSVSTASVIWSGERFKFEAGLRAHGGPGDAVVRQLPVQRQAYVSGTWAF